MYASVFVYFQDGQKQLLYKYLSANVGKDLIPMFEMPCSLRPSEYFSGHCKQFVKLCNTNTVSLPTSSRSIRNSKNLKIAFGKETCHNICLKMAPPIA